MSFASFAGIYWALYGVWFGVGLAVLILVHELGHLIAIRRRGIAAELPMIPVWTLDGGQAMVAINRPGRIGIAIAAVLFDAFFSQPLILLVAGGAAYRAFEKNSAELPVNHGVTAYFMILVATLGYLSALAPLGAGR